METTEKNNDNNIVDLENLTTSTSLTAIICWVLAGFGGLTIFFKILNSNMNSYYLASLLGSSLILFWMGHVVNYLNQIANKK